MLESSNRDEVTSFVTLDGSTIRELARTPRQSLAEATVPAGRATIEHRHRTSEEIYYFLAGHGRLRLGGAERDVAAGDCAVISPGTAHKLWAGSSGDLVLLCACSPAYRDDDTELTEPAGE